MMIQNNITEDYLKCFRNTTADPLNTFQFDMATLHSRKIYYKLVESVGISLIKNSVFL